MSLSHSSEPRRIAQFIYLKPESINEYKAIHAMVWPEVLEAIKSSNIIDCQCGNTSRSPMLQGDEASKLIVCGLDSIHLTLTPRPTLFASFKYTGADFEADMHKMAANEKVREWWRLTDSMQESPVSGKSSVEGGWWGQMEEVFRLD